MTPSSVRNCLAATVLLLASPIAHAIPLGASLSLQLPHPANISIEARPSPSFSASFSLGGLPTVSVNNVSASVFSPNLHGRWHVFGGSFFLGGILGYQTLTGSTTQDILITSPVTATVPTLVSLTIKDLYFTPHLGWAWGMGSRGFFLGLEAGVQVPFAPSSTLDIEVTDPSLAQYVAAVQSTAQYQQAENDVEDVANRIGLLKFPYFALRMGWMF